MPPSLPLAYLRGRIYNLGRGPKNLTGEMMAPNVDEGTQAYAIEWDVVLPMDNTISVVPVPGERQHWSQLT